MVKDERPRYVVFVVEKKNTKGIAPDLSQITKEKIEEKVRWLIKNMYGYMGLTIVGLRMAEYDKNAGVGIIRTNHRGINILRSILAEPAKIEGTELYIKTIKTFGLISRANKLAKKIIKKRREHIGEQ